MKVLVIEDEVRVAKYLKRGLEMKAMVVDVAHDGEAGMDLALSENYDCIVLDRMLPKSSGTKVLKAIRAEGVKTPVLMLTAKAEVQDRVEGLEMGADDYLAKPFDFVELVARIKALSRRPSEFKQDKLSADNLEMDLNKLTVTRKGKEISLSRKEFALLEYLLRNKGRTISKEQLVEEVWSFESEVTLNAVQVYIGYLRRKIDEAFRGEEKLIQTVRGFGYRLGEANK